MNSIFSALSQMCSRTDEEAMCRVKAHEDHLEFARLVRRWDEPIRRLCIRMVGNVHRGEELKQDVFLRLFEKRRQYEPTGRFSTYLWRIALNVCYDDLRRQERRRQFQAETEMPEELADTSPAPGPGPDDHAAATEEGELVRRALLQLPEIYRAVVVLRHYENLKLSRIAEILDIPEGTVNSRMAEALSRLSRMLAPQLQAEPFSPAPAWVTPKEKLVL